MNFFFMYTCLFNDLVVHLPFEDFQMGLLQELNVASMLRQYRLETLDYLITLILNNKH